MNPAAADSPKTLFGQPVGLTFLFLTEMWEKFSFYGMRALLVYYMTKQLAMAQGQASLVYGVYTAFVYFTPIFGGIVSDRWLGRRRSILIGGSVMAAGHFMMAFEPLFYPALACIALGNGLFLPSLPSQAGSADENRGVCSCCSPQSAAQSSCSAAPTNRSAIRSRSGPIQASIAQSVPDFRFP